MQLSKRKKGQLWQSLGLVTANLFMATHGYAAQRNVIDDTSSDLGTATLDSAVLFYEESGGRVKAIEPTTSLKVVTDSGDIFSARVTYDSLTGATPNGAAPWNGLQTFTTPAAPPGEEVAVTSPSGHLTIVTLPGTGTRVAQYTAQPHALPVDAGFMDKRTAFDLGYTKNWTSDTLTSFGISRSKELDFRSLSFRGGVSQSLFDKNTTLTLGVNYEHDTSDPLFGTPTPLTEMNGFAKGPAESKTVTSIIAGVTQVMNRRWLFQLNYDIGWNNGYQTDPYKIVSVVDGTSGSPLQYLYESRPDSRVRQSVYVGNKIAFGPTVADISFRYYHDSWGIKSMTGEMAERVPLTRALYLEPTFHYYRQTAADFFTYYLTGGEPLPEFASADGRLAKFDAYTIGMKVGYQLSRHAELYGLVEDYKQSGDSTVAGAPGELANEDFFSGVRAASVIIGFNYKFDLSNVW